MEIRAVKFRVGAEWRVGGLYSPGQRGPGVLMLHGFPGVQQNEDLAAELCRRGMTVLLPHYRGCWGSPGRFHVEMMFTDAAAALRLLSRYHQVDPGRVGVLGCSIGGWVALKLAADARLAAVAVLAPAAPRTDRPGDAGYLRRNARALAIPDPLEVWREYAAAARADHPEEYVHRIAPTPVLFAQGMRDRLVPPESTRRLWALARAPKDWKGFPGEDHEFQNDRPAVVNAVCGWLEERLARAPVETLESLETADVGGES